MTKGGERLRADLSLLLVALIWGGAFVAQRIAGQQGEVFLFNGLRFLIGAIVLLPFAGSRLHLDREFWRWAGLAGAVLFVAAALQQAGLRWTTAGNAGFLTGLYVVVVPVIVWLGWRQRPGRTTAFSIPLALVGAFLLSTGGRFQLRPGDLLELAGAVFWGLHLVLLSKFAVRFDPLRFSLGQFLVCGLLNLFSVLLVEPASIGSLVTVPLPAARWSLILPALYTGLLSVGLGYTLQVWGQRHTPPADAALILSLEAVFAAVFGWWFLAEKLDPAQAAGAVLILLAVLLIQLRPQRTGGAVV